MASGIFRHPVTVQRLTGVRNEYGEKTDTWEDLFETWAEVKPIRSREFFSATAVNSEVTHRVVMRYDSRVKANMRILHEGRIFEIEGPPRDYMERHDKIELLCREAFDE